MARNSMRRDRTSETHIVEDSVRSAGELMNSAAEAIGRGIGAAASMADDVIERGKQVAGVTVPRRVRAARRSATTAAAKTDRSINKAARSADKAARSAKKQTRAMATTAKKSAREGARRTSNAAARMSRSVAAAAPKRKKAGRKK
jgi:hypothetical protein